MNDLMSGGLHRLWKRHTIDQAAFGQGTSCSTWPVAPATWRWNLPPRLARTVMSSWPTSTLRCCEQGRDRLVDAGVAGNLSIAQVDAENLPFADSTFDRITIAFGLRNVTDKDAALRSMFRVLKPGGKALILEFSKPDEALKPAYDLYSFKVLPVIGKLVADDSDSYQYLAESIRMHPDQETLLGMMKDAGFERCRYQNLAGGIVALHIGYRI